MTRRARDVERSRQAPLGPGVRVTHHLILRRLAVGGMAEVFLARTEGGPAGDGVRRVVALKAVLPSLAADEHFVGMFLDEARLGALLLHPNIVPVFETGRAADGRPFYTMEHVDGPDLATVLRLQRARGGPVPLEIALSIAAAVAAGLHHAHQQRGHDGEPLGIVHRDVSPANVLVSRNGHVKLIDFGVARATTQLAATRDGAIKGKFAYMSPEQCRGESVDARSDVFALGLLLYELTTGAHPFAGETDVALLRALSERDAAPPSTLVDGYPPALEAIVMRALARDRRARYATAEAVQIDIETFARDERLVLSTVEVGRFIDELCPREPSTPESFALEEALVPRRLSAARGLARIAVGLLATAGLMAGAWAMRHRAAGRACGDGVVDPGEECDDGNLVETDACRSTCRWARCGDGVVRTGVEECDPAAHEGAGCTARCLRCGADGRSLSRAESGHCYTRESSPLPWRRAQAACWGAGGHLVTYTSGYEVEEVYQALLAGSTEGHWTGRLASGKDALPVWDTDERVPPNVLGTRWEGPVANPANDECPLQLPRVAIGALRAEVIWRAAACARPAPYLCERTGWVIRERDNHAYRLFRQRSQWRAANETCRRAHGHLATVSDADEESFLESAFGGALWLGADDEAAPGHFRWITGEPLRYAKWAPREPDQSMGKMTYCLALDVDGVWHDRTCVMEYPFVCEID